MHGYNFTERVRKVLRFAREEAERLHHGYVGTEHILLGLIREGEGVSATVLENLGGDVDAMRATIQEVVKPGKTEEVGPDLPYTSRAKKVLELAMTEARELNHSYVGTEHLLLGLLREKKGIAAQVLVDGGITLEKARLETLRLLGTEPPKGRVLARTMGSPGSPPVIAVPPEAMASMRETIESVRMLNERAVHVLELAREEAVRLKGREVGPTHILLGLLRGDGLAARLLAEAGVTVDAVRAEIERNAP